MGKILGSSVGVPSEVMYIMSVMREANSGWFKLLKAE